MLRIEKKNKKFNVFIFQHLFLVFNLKIGLIKYLSNSFYTILLLNKFLRLLGLLNLSTKNKIDFY